MQRALFPRGFFSVQGTDRGGVVLRMINSDSFCFLPLQTLLLHGNAISSMLRFVVLIISLVRFVLNLSLELDEIADTACDIGFYQY